MTAASDPQAYPPPARRALITVTVMISTMMVALDTTIANVALPHMQSSLGASPEQVVWVLTSYLIASAVMTPLSSWLAGRFGRRLVMSASAAGFTLASLACGLSTSLEMMVIARMVQGISGAGLIPLGQATLLDINPPERQARAMAMTGLGSMLGPLAGPTLGGWLTDMFTWRWVFLINIPIGILALIGLLANLQETRERQPRRFDLFGFATISIFLGAFQLMLDRGQQLDWFDSREIWIEAGIMLVAGWMALVHMFTARNSFIPVEMFRDRNFALGCVVSAVIGVIAFATVPIVTVMMQTLLGYTPYHTGLVSMPRGAGTILGLLVVTNFAHRMDPRLLLVAGLSMMAFSLFLYARINLETDEPPLLVAGLLQGMAGGLIIAPLTALSFSTLAPHFRNEGTAVYALVRNIGSSLGISALQMFAIHNTAAVTNRLAEGVRVDNPVMQWAQPDFGFDVPSATAMMAGQIWRQASMVATVDSMWLAAMMALAALPVALVMRAPRKA